MVAVMALGDDEGAGGGLVVVATVAAFGGQWLWVVLVAICDLS